MHFSTIIPLATLLSSVLALPTVLPIEESSELVTRATGTSGDPIILTINCAGVEEVCEAQCLAVLCFGSPAVMQYDSTKKSDNFKNSGAGKLFKGAPTLMAKKGVAIPPSHPDYTSAEETTNEVAVEGGYGTLLVPVNTQHNTSTYLSSLLTFHSPSTNLVTFLDEGSRFAGQLKSTGIKQLQYYKKSYTGLGSATPYCNAYQSNPPNTAVCSGAKSADDPINFVYRKTMKKSGNAYLFQQMSYPTDKWSKNF
jgi:hypothetical protein